MCNYRIQDWRRPERSPSVFTLIELLVVIAIIGILASLLLPALQNARQSATSLACRNNLRNIALGIRMYLDDNEGYYPMMREKAGGKWWHQSTSLMSYLGNDQQILTCPTDTTPATMSYTMVWYGGGSLWHVTGNPYFEGYHMRLAHNEVRVFLVDTSDPVGRVTDKGLFGGSTATNPDNNYMYEGKNVGNWGGRYGDMELRHGWQMNVLSVDLAVRSVNLASAEYSHYALADPAQLWYRVSGNMPTWPYASMNRFSAGLFE